MSQAVPQATGAPARLPPKLARRTIAAACFGWLFSAVDIVLLVLFQRPVADSLGADVQSVRIAIGVGLLGSAAGGIALAQLGDRIGRVRALGWCVLLYSAATAGMGLARRPGELMAWRFLSGIGTGAEWSIGFALIAEVQGTKGRGRVGGLVAAMSLAFYSISTVFINYLQDDAARGGLGLDARGQFPYQLALNLGALASVVAAGIASDRIGRRAAFAAFCLVGAAGSAWLYLIMRDAAGVPPQLIAVFTVVVIGYGINGVVGTLLAELFPTHLRSTGPGLCQNLGKGIGGLAGPPLAGAMVPVAGYPVVLALPGLVVLALAGLVWLLPRAGGRELRPLEGDGYLDPGPDAGSAAQARQRA